MSNESTINKLVEMHMTPMANAFRVQLSDPNIGRLSFEERFTLIVDAEYNALSIMQDLISRKPILVT